MVCINCQLWLGWLLDRQEGGHTTDIPTTVTAASPDERQQLYISCGIADINSSAGVQLSTRPEWQLAIARQWDSKYRTFLAEGRRTRIRCLGQVNV